LKELRSRSKQPLKELGICAWLEAACAATVADEKASLSLVAALGKSSQWWFLRERVRAAKIVLADTGDLVAAQDAVIDGATEDVDGVYQVEPELLAESARRRKCLSICSRLQGWSRHRRIVILRRRTERSLATEGAADGQLRLGFAEIDRLLALLARRAAWAPPMGQQETRRTRAEREEPLQFFSDRGEARR
jgi:hypothetical protein